MSKPTILTQGTRRRCGAVLSLVLMLGISPAATADEADAKRILKAMSDYVGAQKMLSFEYDATLEVVSAENQKLALASSGTVTLSRPDKIHVTRAGGFVDVELVYDGKTLTVLGKNMNLYAQEMITGNLENLVNELHVKYDRPLPAADLLLADSYPQLMQDVIDVKDLGSGVIGGVECDYLAFRAKSVDWQIWIAQGEHPYPCRYSITSKEIEGSPQYSIQTRNWKTGKAVGATNFSFSKPSGASKVDINDLKGAEGMPENFTKGEAQ